MTDGAAREGRVGFMSRALLAKGLLWRCYGDKAEGEKWFMMDADGWSTPEVKVRNVCTCVYLSVRLRICIHARMTQFKILHVCFCVCLCVCVCVCAWPLHRCNNEKYTVRA